MVVIRIPQRTHTRARGCTVSLTHTHAHMCFTCISTSQLFHQPLTVLLLGPGVMDSSSSTREPAAIVSRSNRQLRQALDAAGAHYTMAAAAAAAAAEQGGSGKQKAQGRGQQQQQSTIDDGKAGSQLLVQGARGMQAVYLLLQQQAWCSGEAAGDVPLLLAPVPFAGAVLCPCTFTVRAWGCGLGLCVQVHAQVPLFIFHCLGARMSS